MPFAEKFRFTMRLPKPGGRLGEFTVESCEVGHDEHGDGTIDYPVSMILVGKGGRQAAGKAVRAALAAGHTTFSGFGNPYQLRFGRCEVESLGDGRYRVTGCGLGVRIDLERELRRFVEYTRAHHEPASGELVARYLEVYKRDVTRRSPEFPY